MRKTRLLISVIYAAIFASLTLAQTASELKRGFASPPDDSRIMMRWWWFGPSVTKAEIERELRVMKEGGIGGVEVQPVYPLLPDDEANGIKNLPYLSDEFLEMLKFAAQKSKELGMRFDLTLGSGWSFGGAKTPITEAAGQLRVERVVIDSPTSRVPMPSTIPAEKFIAAFSRRENPLADGFFPFREARDIHDGSVWFPQPLEKGTEVLFFISGKSGMQVKRPAFGAEGYVLNHLDKPSVDSYLKNTGDRLFSVLDKSLVPYSVFCDSLEVYNQDWTDDFLAEFQRRRGYDLRPYLPALVSDIGAKTADIRYDWGRTITELFNDRFMVPMQEWSKKNGTRFRIQGYGLPPASISSNKWADISDGEGAQWKVVRAARWASSANHAYGRNITSSETWTWLHSPVFRATPLDLKAEADIHFLQGINQLIGHGWAYTPPQVEYPGWRFYAAGIYDEKNPWWIVMPDLAKYLQRMSWLMRQGQPHADVALYLPNADAYSHMTAGKVHLIDMERELVGEKIMPAIFEAGFNLDFFDDEILKSEGKIDKGNLIFGNSEHRIVVLPGIERMPLETLRKLRAFVKSGGVLIASGRVPEVIPGMNVTEAERAEFATLIRELFGGQLPLAEFVKTEEELQIELVGGRAADASISPSAKDFGTVHRRTEDADIYFVANTSNQKRTVRIGFRSTRPQIERWDAMTGQITSAANVTRLEHLTYVPLDFEPYQSQVIVFSDGSATMSPPRNKETVATSIDLGTDWDVSFGQGAATKMTQLRSWSESESTRYYSGIATYKKTVNIDQTLLAAGTSIFLEFGSATELPVQQLRNGMQTWIDPPIREAAVIYVNGQKAGSLWCPPYSLDITKLLRPGRNELKIDVGNTALNYMAGRKLPDYKLLNLRYGERFQPQDMDKIQALPSGIVGNVKIVTYK